MPALNAMPAVKARAVVNALALAAQPDLTRSASQQRQHDPDFVQRCASGTSGAQLPLRWPTPPELPPSPKPRYRSRYQPPDPARVQSLDLAAWESIGLFDLLLLLVDFSGLRPILASKLYRASALGRVPFDPISFFPLFGWQLVDRRNRLEVLRHLNRRDQTSHCSTACQLSPTAASLRVENLSDTRTTKPQPR